MCRQGTTLLFVSHSIESVKGICDYALWLNKGTVKAKGPVDRVCDAYIASLQS